MITLQALKTCLQSQLLQKTPIYRVNVCVCLKALLSFVAIHIVKPFEVIMFVMLNYVNKINSLPTGHKRMTPTLQPRLC